MEETKNVAAQMQQTEENAAEIAAENIDNMKTAEWYKHVSLEDSKAFIRANLTGAARSFIAIGYYLKHIRDEELYREDGHETIWDFAQAEYGISKSTASRYMAMNDRFSVEGNSPIMLDEYRGFDKSKLQEMLYLDDNQMEQVTPDMKVSEIRGMRMPKEIPYFELEGQLDIETDFPEVLPTPVQREKPQEFTLDLSELVGDEEREAVATSQQTDISQGDEIIIDTSTCPPGNNGSCRCREWGTSPEEQEVGHKECVKCWEDWKKAVKVCHADIQAEREVDKEVSEQEEQPLLAYGTLKRVYSENLEEKPLTDLQIAREELERANNLLRQCLISLPDETDEHIRRMKVKVLALKSYVCDLDDIENPPEQPELPEQLEFPLLKNNDQRAAFVDGYLTWPLWIETKETGERYYRYDLSDGTSMVVKVYHARLFDYNRLDVPWEERYIEGYGEHEYYLLAADKFFKDCKVNRSTLIEKLKAIQKKGVV